MQTLGFFALFFALFLQTMLWASTCVQKKAAKISPILCHLTGKQIIDFLSSPLSLMEVFAKNIVCSLMAKPI